MSDGVLSQRRSRVVTARVFAATAAVSRSAYSAWHDQWMKMPEDLPPVLALTIWVTLLAALIVFAVAEILDVSALADAAAWATVPATAIAAVFLIVTVMGYTTAILITALVFVLSVLRRYTRH